MFISVYMLCIWKLSAYDQFSKTDERITLYYMYQTEVGVISSQLLFFTLIIVHDLAILLENVQVYLLSNAVKGYCKIHFGNPSIIGTYF